MSRKNHKLIDGKLLQTDKRYSCYDNADVLIMTRGAYGEEKAGEPAQNSNLDEKR